ncbi:non-ribosomal peptide synthetase [Kitasatospora purpeofusca]|uniref:non-ribosomal peptide synthetase n=1 Tax=Kitasatospora purpeofusca TaxID=67352 RepID=UPI002252D1C6|nr:non-ribosomal peptide synthetase [Kitasatospora purpeofusca]MCX4683047.1 non-ribosomal peptide synthetase [Kitasatospora purpeofusca]
MSDHDLLHTRVLEGAPGATAWLDSAGRPLSHRELAERSGRLARRLVDAGAGPGERVALFLERGADMAVAVLGVLRAGAAFVPLGLQEPAPRLARILADCAPVVVLVHDATSARFGDGGGVRTLGVNGDWDWDGDWVQEAGAPDDPAYVLYTSGSSGTPKGVVVEHRNLTPHLEWLAERLPLGAGDRLLQVTPYTFDASLTDFFWPLGAGATVVSLAEGDHQDPLAIATALVEHGITAVRLPPAMLSLLLDEPEFRKATALRYLISGGDRLPTSVAHRIVELLPGVRLFNRYGPTEAAVAVSYHEFDADTDTGPDVPIGVGVTGAELHVSADGELLIGGACVARGYLGDVALTEQRFVQLPNVGRVFRSGDRVRTTAAGTLEFLGRDDEQVQVNGHRVELGEVMSALRAHPDVQDCVVLPQGQALAGFVVAAPDRRSADGIHAHLRGRLPGHMVPNVIVFVDRLPVTERGKVDLAALRALSAGGTTAGAEGTEGTSADRAADGDPVLEVVRRVWSRLLGGIELREDDDFFERGGHSLLAVQAVGRIRKELGHRVPPRIMFERTTLGGFAEEVTRIVAAAERR